MIDFGERHIVELAAADDDRGVALDALHRADALAVGAVKLGAGADLFARRAGEVGGIDAFLHRAIGLIDGVADRIGTVLDGGLATASVPSTEVDCRHALAADAGRGCGTGRWRRGGWRRGGG